MQLIEVGIESFTKKSHELPLIFFDENLHTGHFNGGKSDYKVEIDNRSQLTNKKFVSK